MLLPIFCNLCIVNREEIQRKYFVTSCSHVLCEACIDTDKKFCKLCNTSCKVIEINKHMPSDVKMFFDDQSIDQMVQKIQKIRDFQENQLKMFHGRSENYLKKFEELNKSLIGLHRLREQGKALIQSEKEIQERLKAAAYSNVITTDLFHLRSSTSLNKPSSSVAMTGLSSHSTASSNVFSRPSQTSLRHMPKSGSIVSQSSGSMSISRSSGSMSVSSSRTVIPNSITAAYNPPATNAVRTTPYGKRKSSPFREPYPVLRKEHSSLMRDTMIQNQKESQEMFQQMRFKHRRIEDN